MLTLATRWPSSRYGASGIGGMLLSSTTRFARQHRSLAKSAKNPSYGLMLVEKPLDPSLLAITLGEYS